jgi:hypothetical protein
MQEFGPRTVLRLSLAVICLLVAGQALAQSGDATSSATPSAATIIEQAIDDGGIEAATAKFDEIAGSGRDDHEVSEQDLNALGYRLLSQARIDEAVAVFRMNRAFFPEAWNTWDSLGEAFMYADQRDSAIVCYQRSFELNPDNWQADWRVRAMDWFLVGTRGETRTVAQHAPGESTGLVGRYLGQVRPGREPQLFAPGVISTFNRLEYAISFSPDGKECYFSTSNSGLLVSRWGEDGWTVPERAAFTRDHPRAFEPHITPDGDRLFIGHGPEIRILERTADGWGNSQLFGPGMYATTTRDGVVYVTDISEEAGGGAIVRAQPTADGYTDPEPLGPAINSDHVDAHPLIAPDESWLIFDSRRPGAIGGEEDGDFYVSFARKDGGWSDAMRLGEEMNDPGDNMCATLSPDGKYLFFTAYRDIYWVSAEILEPYRAIVRRCEE